MTLSLMTLTLMTLILMTLTLMTLTLMTLIPIYSYSNFSGICEFGKYNIIFTNSSSMG